MLTILFDDYRLIKLKISLSQHVWSFWTNEFIHAWINHAIANIFKYFICHFRQGISVTIMYKLKGFNRRRSEYIPMWYKWPQNDWLQLIRLDHVSYEVDQCMVGSFLWRHRNSACKKINWLWHWNMQHNIS